MNKIETITGVMPGYGGPTLYWSRLVWNNKELEKIESVSAYDCGYRTAKAEAKWNRVKNLDAKASDKPQAFVLCDFCRGECRKIIYQYDFQACSEPCRAECEKQLLSKRAEPTR